MPEQNVENPRAVDWDATLPMPVRAMFVSVRGVDPVVSALRETSIVFAVIISAVVLRERVRRQRWLAAGLIVVGVGGGG